MRECKFVASRKVDGDVKKHATALARAATKYGAQVARRKIEDGMFKAGVVCPSASVETSFGSYLSGKGWMVVHALPKAAKPEKADAKTGEETPQETPRGPHVPIEDTLEARNGARWGSDEMREILKSLGVTMACATKWSCNVGRALGFFRIDPWKAWFNLGGAGDAKTPLREPQPKSSVILKMIADKFGTECEAYKFYRLQSVGFRPELLKTKTKTTNRKAK